MPVSFLVLDNMIKTIVHLHGDRTTLIIAAQAMRNIFLK